jgi:predicted PurR-regulated permease PerM
MTHNRESFMPPRWILAIAGLTLLGWLAVRLKEIVVLLVIGFFIAYVVDPVLRMFERYKVPRTIGFFIVCGALVVVFGGGIILVGPTIVEEFHKLTSNLSGYLNTSRQRVLPALRDLQGLLPVSIRGLIDLDDINGSIGTLLSGVTGETLKNLGKTVLGSLLHGYSQALAMLNIVLLPFIVFYLAVDLPKLYQFVINLFPLTKRSGWIGAFQEIDGYISAYVRGQIVVCCILFVLYAIGLGALGVDLWLLLAAIAGFGNMVPYVGTALGIFFSSVMALVTFGSFTYVAWVWGIFALVQFMEGVLITPRIMGGSIGLSPLVVILSLFAGGQLFGLLGVFLAIPTAAALRVLIRHSYHWAVDS